MLQPKPASQPDTQHRLNEMVSTGDTVISLHTRSPDQLPKFSFSEGGTPDQLKVPRSAQIFIWGEGGLGTPD